MTLLNKYIKNGIIVQLKSIDIMFSMESTIHIQHKEYLIMSDDKCKTFATFLKSKYSNIEYHNYFLSKGIVFLDCNKVKQFSISLLEDDYYILYVNKDRYLINDESILLEVIAELISNFEVKFNHI